MPVTEYSKPVKRGLIYKGKNLWFLRKEYHTIILAKMETNLK